MNLNFRLLIFYLTQTFIFSSCDNRTEPEWHCGDVDIDTLIKTVSQQKIVVEKSRLIDSLSNHSRQLSFLAQPYDTSEVIYLIKVCEDNNLNLVTYYNFLIDIRTHKIINPSGNIEGQ